MINIQEQLVSNISKKYLFYFPSSIYSEIENSVIAGMIPYETYDIILYNKDKVGAIAYDLENIATADILNKNSLLKNNLLLLIDSKTKVSANAFKFILDDYMNLINSHVYITNWLFNNVKKKFPELSNIMFNAFKNQSNFFNQHSLQLEQHFQLRSQEPNLDTLDLMKTMKMSFSPPTVKADAPQLDVSSKPQTSIPLKKTKPKISDEEIDQFLLKTVFGVDFS